MSIEWEIYQDESYYHMWAVRPVGDTDFNSPRLFHFNTKEQAEAFVQAVKPANIAIEQKEVNKERENEIAAIEATELVTTFFKEQADDKVKIWFNTPNPGLGNIIPNVMIKIGRAKKLVEFIKSQIEGNFP